jgi:hypothetical protein
MSLSGDEEPKSPTDGYGRRGADSQMGEQHLDLSFSDRLSLQIPADFPLGVKAFSPNVARLSLSW